MRKAMTIGMGIFLLCGIPFGVFAQNDPVDKGSVEFEVGSIFDIAILFNGLFEGNRLTELTVGSNILQLQLGYFVIDRLSIGGFVAIEAVKFELADDASLAFDFGPVVRYYFPVAKTFLINVEGHFEFISVKDTIGGVRVDEAINQVALGGGVDGTYLITPNIGIGVGGDYTHIFNARFDGSSISGTNFDIIDISLFLRIFL